MAKMSDEKKVEIYDTLEGLDLDTPKGRQKLTATVAGTSLEPLASAYEEAMATDDVAQAEVKAAQKVADKTDAKADKAYTKLFNKVEKLGLTYSNIEDVRAKIEEKA